MYYIALGQNTKLLSFNNFSKKPDHAFIKKVTPYLLQLNLNNENNKTKLKDKIKKVIEKLLSKNHYKTSYKTNSPVSQQRSAHFEIDSYSINYIVKTHFVTSFEKPFGVDVKDIRDYTNQITSHLTPLNLNSTKDEIYIIDVDLFLSKKLSSIKTGEKTTCKNVKNKYNQYYNYTKKRIKNKFTPRTLNITSRRGRTRTRGNNNNIQFTNRINNTQKRKQQRINHLKKKQTYYDPIRYPREVDYITDLRKKVLKEMTGRR